MKDQAISEQNWCIEMLQMTFLTPNNVERSDKHYISFASSMACVVRVLLQEVERRDESDSLTTLNLSIVLSFSPA